MAFPEGSPWAQLILADDDTYMVMAIQAMDRQRAVDALRDVRALHRTYGPPEPTAAVTGGARRPGGQRP